VITVEALLRRSDLDLRLLAGAAGGGRMVVWAHAVDLPDPWRWVHR
jgi:purine catabolism regulator